MKKIFAIIILMMCCNVALADEGMSRQEFSKLSAIYYEKKDVNDAIKMMRYLDSDKEILTGKNAQAPLEGLIAGIITSTPDFKSKIAGEKFSPELTTLIQNSEKRLVEIKEGMLNDNKKISTADLDMYWGYYGTTGDINAVKKITRALDPANNDEGILVTLAAVWSLGAQAKRYPAVAELLKDPEIDAKMQMIKNMMSKKK